MIFFFYVYMVFLALGSSAGCAWYSYRLGSLKTTQTSPWYLISAGFAMSLVHELYKLLYYLDILNALYEFEVGTLIVSQIIQTLMYVLPLTGLAIMFKRRERDEQPS